MPLAKAMIEAAGNSTQPTYIEDVFSTWLYTGNGSTQTITNGIDLAGEGGMVWCKIRNTSDAHALFDTARGFPNYLVSNATIAQNGYGAANTNDMQPTATGFSMANTSSASNSWNSSGNTFASWTFRKAPKFFDVVTYTGNSTPNRKVSHNLGSVPGMMIVKRTDTTGRWFVYHKDIPNTNYLVLNTTAASVAGANVWNNTSPTSTEFTVGINTEINTNGGTYVAYLFAHNAGGFGLTGTDNVISCGSYTGNGSATGPVVSLGYEPQWLMIKNASGTGNWQIIDNMRGMPVGSADATLQANLTNAESSTDYVSPTSTGFQVVSTSTEVNTSASTYIYIAIRRGPMKTPTSGTEVFSPIAYTGNGTSNQLVGSITVDASFSASRNLTNPYNAVFSRLMGNKELATSGTTPEYTSEVDFSQQMGLRFTGLTYTGTNNNAIQWQFKRAPGFFDVVCYAGTGVARTVAHNLGVAPELMIVKERSAADNWNVYCQYLSSSASRYIQLNTTIASTTSTALWNSTDPTDSVFTVGSSNNTNQSGQTYVAYLFASCPGVSKVGSYTGTGTTQQINCGFTAGARFVLIKRTDSTGDWYVWDSARGIVAGNDPYLLLNSTAAEVTSTDYIDPVSSGFEISSTAPAAINASGGSFIYLAIA